MAVELRQPRLPLARGRDGVIRFRGSRVTLDTLVQEYRSGQTAGAIAENYPTLPLAHVYAAIAFYLSHREAVDQYMAAGSAEAAEVRREIEARPAAKRFRALLMRRRRAMTGGSAS